MKEEAEESRFSADSSNTFAVILELFALGLLDLTTSLL
jgi:hypothetical protein